MSCPVRHPRTGCWRGFAQDGDPNVELAPAWPQCTAGGELPQFVAPSARQVGHPDIDSAHDCSLWDEVSPAP